MKPVWQRFLIVLAGPMANFLLAILIFAAFFATLGMPRTPPVAFRVAPGSAAEHAGLVRGDRIVAVDGRPPPVSKSWRRYVILRPSQEVTVDFVRHGAAAPGHRPIAAEEQRDAFGQRFRIGRLGVFARGANMCR